MAMADTNLNALWCRCIAEELDRAGVARVVACPGSRNSPLLFALAGVFGERLWTHWDERGAGFMALGAAKELGAPVAVCVTSGTAAANLLPAACEASAAGVPLVLLTADRPWEQHGCGAPQAMPQRALFGPFAAAVEIGEPVAEAGVLRLLRARVSRAAASGGPVHLNVPLRDPLPPLPGSGWIPPALADDALHGRGPAPWVAVAGGPDGSDLAAAEPHLRSGLRGLIVAGSDGCADPAQAAALAAATGFPVLADAASGLRRPAVPGAVASLDALADAAIGREAPELIIRLGSPPLARAAFEWLDRQACPQLALGGIGDPDFLARVAVHWPRPSAALFAALGARLAVGDRAWAGRWAAAEAGAQAARSATAAGQGFSEPAVYHAACSAGGFDRLWLASSMPVRHANLHLAPAATPQRVLSNRGVNGIDGTVASFLGACRAGGGRGLCLVGDLALLHDLNSLALAAGSRGAVLVANNGGGAIFDALPVARLPGYRGLVRADHGWDFAHAAAQFALPYRRCADPAALASALAEAAVADAMLLIECDLRGRDGIADHRAVLAAMR